MARTSTRGRLRLNGQPLSLADVLAIAREGRGAVLGRAARARMEQAHQALLRLEASGETIYGVTTGVGKLTTVTIPPEDRIALQHNLLRSHACGVGPPLPREVVRAILLLRAHALAHGYSGVRVEVAERLLELLNADLLPHLPSRGSVGASGDLAPLAHVGLVLIGEGEVMRGEAGRGSARTALRRARIVPLSLQTKEALSLINGTQAMAALGVLACADARMLLGAAQVATAASVEALKATDVPFEDRFAKLRPHPGQRLIARNLRALLIESEILPSHRGCAKVQDPYSLRCAPQILGAVADALGHTEEVLQREINAVTDNPLIFPEADHALSGGNFHGQPLAFVLDYLGLAIHVLGAVSERRLARLVDAKLSELPAFLTRHEGLHSGFMVPQYIAAALVSETKLLSHPASADSLPTSAGQEDYNSMGMLAALKAREIVEKAEAVVAIELLAAAQALEFIPLQPGRGVVAAVAAIRRLVPPLAEDRPMGHEIEQVRALIHSGELVRAVQRRVPLRLG